MRRRVAMLFVVAAGFMAAAPGVAAAAATDASGSSGGPLCVRVPVPAILGSGGQIQIGICTS